MFETGIARGIDPARVRRITDILDLLNAAAQPGDMNFPGSFLHPLKGRLAGFWAVRVSGNWRIVFRMEKGDALDVDYVDYH